MKLGWGWVKVGEDGLGDIIANEGPVFFMEE